MNTVKLFTLLNKENESNIKYAGIRYLITKNDDYIIVPLYEDKKYPLGNYMSNNKFDEDKYLFAFNSKDFLKNSFKERNFLLFEALDIYIYEITLLQDNIIKGFNQSIFNINNILTKDKILYKNFL